MQGFLSLSPAPRSGASRLLRHGAPHLPRKHNSLIGVIERGIGGVAHDRDRWVPVVCAAGFALLMWVDWLAA